MRLYHGSPARKDRTPFGSIGNTAPDICPGRPFFVTGNLNYAEHFARGGLVTEIRAQLISIADLRDKELQQRLLSIYNADPFVISKGQQWDEEVDGDIADSAYMLLESPDVMTDLTTSGFTAAIIDEQRERGITSYALLCPEEVLSVTLLSTTEGIPPLFRDEPHMKKTTANDAFEQGKTAYGMGMKLSNDPYDAGAPAFTEEGLRSDAWRRGMIAAWDADGQPEGRLDQHHINGAGSMKSPEKNTEQPATPSVAPLYSYVVNLNERGCFSASVYDSNEKSVYEVRGGDELGEDESSLVDDGFMDHMEDLEGLTSYLQSLSIIPAGARILPEKEFEAALDEYIEEQREANRRVLYVLAAPTVSKLDLEDEDQEVPGAYQVLIYSDLPPEDWADTALDCFHYGIAIGNLDDFEITVVDPLTQQVLSQRDDYEAYSGKDNGDYDGKIDEDWERYMPAQQDASPTPSM